jgi:FixJ family two-component response regulator
MDGQPEVFVVDDEEGVRISLAKLIRLLGYASRSFASAQEFLASDAVEHCGCVLVDLRMPGMSGIDLVQEIARRRLPLAAIMMSGHADSEMLARLGAIETLGVLEKPFPLDALRAILARWRAPGGS